MALEILKWFLLANLAIGSVLKIALIGWQPPKYTKAGAVINLLMNVALAICILLTM